jgi:hypothetical protein
MSTQPLIEGILDVKGDATDASPILTCIDIMKYYIWSSQTNTTAVAKVRHCTDNSYMACCVTISYIAKLAQKIQYFASMSMERLTCMLSPFV